MGCLYTRTLYDVFITPSFAFPQFFALNEPITSYTFNAPNAPNTSFLNVCITPSLPAGLSISQQHDNTFQLTGTPTEASNMTVYMITVKGSVNYLGRILSHIGRKAIMYPAEVTISHDTTPITTPRISSEYNNTLLTIKGPLGEHALPIKPFVKLAFEQTSGESSATAGQILKIAIDEPDVKHQRAMWGTTRALIQNAITGVLDGYRVPLRLVGVGYRASLEEGGILALKLGFSHPVDIPIPHGIKVNVPAPNRIVLQSTDLQQRGLLRMSWNKYNLFNLATRTLPQTNNKTLYQQKWQSKKDTRAYHGEQLNERQFAKIFSPRLPTSNTQSGGSDASAGSKHPPVTSLTFASLERRLDFVVFRACFAPSINAARQLCVHGKVKVNGKKMAHPSHTLKPGDMISLEPKSISTLKAPEDPSQPHTFVPHPYSQPHLFVPNYLEVNYKTCSAVYVRDPMSRPGRVEVPSPWPASVQALAYEFYARRRK
ncbi:hypothetical protein BZG36_01624 [Bifiguratus adelaidae]|uniref:RNA-binding S4 domain-containing protein n=1 Tax=Bifiguratus adelaidae TaxID=1938954 RepID=A0A261Y4E2_9FUNG|nr:hypothetical protein BZG36_01624 [Bifiguratus adelaidae]